MANSVRVPRTSLINFKFDGSEDCLSFSYFTKDHLFSIGNVDVYIWIFIVYSSQWWQD